MKAQLRVKAKSPTVAPKKPSHRAAKPDAWAEWLEAIAAQGLEVSQVLAEHPASTFPEAIWSEFYSDAAPSGVEANPWHEANEPELLSPQISASLNLIEPVESQTLESTASYALPETTCVEELEPTLAPEPDEMETTEGAIAEFQPPSWFHSKEQASATDAPPDDPIEAAIAQSQAIDLPYKAILESRLGQSLNDIEVYGGTPEIRDALDQLDACAALYDQHILFAESNPDVETATHEVIHALQARSGVPSEKPDLLPVTAPAEQEARQLTQEIVRSLDSGKSSTLPWVPIAIHTTLHPGAIARLRAAPPPTVGENAQPTEILEATANREDRTPAPAASEPSSEPAPSAAQAESEATLEDDGLAPPVSGELEEVPALEAPTPPEPGITETDVAAREAEMAQTEAALAAATDVDEKVDAYAAAPPTLKAQEQSTLGADLDALAKSESASFQEEIPDFQVTLSGETEELPELQVEAPPAGDVSLEDVPPEPAPDPDIPPTPDPVAYTANEVILRVISRFTEGNSPQDRAGEIGETLDDVRTTDPDVETSPGEPPAVPLEGETDPERIPNQLQEGRDQATQARDEAQQAVINGPGPEQVQPLVIEEAVPLGELAEPELAQSEPVPTIEDFNQREMPREVNTAFDLNNQENMQASLAEAQTQVQQTTEERDRARQEQLDTAQAEADRQTLEADQGQRDAVQDQRERIQTERQTTLEEQTQAVRDIEDQAETRRTEDHDAIDDRVRGDQEAIRNDYQQAERDADAEVSEGERDAEAERREAEREAENQSWWDRAVSFVQEAFAALTSAISAIFDAVRAAINTILDAVKAAAEALINLAADFIRSAIAAFGDFLKGLVDGLLGDLFPGLAAALNEFIDEAVQLAQQAVDAVAETLRNGINALVEGLRAGLNAVLDVMQAGLELASGLIQAALAGDWGAVIRLLLEAVLKVIGIEPETFYGFIGRAEETFQKILDDPGAVVGHLLDAVKQGIQQFADNFLPHLQAGIIGWLTGALGADIQIPTEFNLMGVLDLARQIMGLTLQFIRRIAVRLIGEENVERIESLFGYVQTLITGGWSALFEQITESLGNLRDMVLDQIKEFLVTRLVIAAITKLATMFNPVGAIVQLVLTAWNIYTFLRDNLQRMIQIVQSIVEGISNIVNGVIAPAATRIEETLANLLPIATSFLASLLGIGGIANRVRQIIDSVRDRIENAIVTFIQRIASRFTGRGRGTGATPGETPTEPATSADSLHRNLAQQALQTINSDDQGDTPQEIINHKRQVAQRFIQTSIPQLGEGLRFTITLTNEQQAIAGQDLLWEAVIAPNTTRLTLRDSADEPTFELDIRRRGEVQENVQQQIHGSLVANSGGYTIAYVGNIPLGLGSSADARRPATIATMYGQQGFGGRLTEAAQRFSLVIGANTFVRLSREHESWLTAVAGVSWNGYPLAVLAFAWEPFWKQISPQRDGISTSQLRQELNFEQLPNERKAELQQEERKATNQTVIPYGPIRDLIARSSATQTFTRNLRAQGENVTVFIHVGDADAVTLQGAGERVVRTGTIEPGPVITALFSRYDRILEENRDSNGELPAIASGGYEFRFEIAGGDVPPSDQLTVIANNLDTAIRRAMASVNPRTVYFPEPNTLIRVTGANTIEASFGGGSREGAEVVADLLRRRPDLSDALVFDARAAIVTQSERFAATSAVGESRVTLGRVENITAVELESIFNQKQSHARPQVWQEQMRTAYGIALGSLGPLQERYFPHFIGGRFVYEPDVLRAQLRRFNPRGIGLDERADLETSLGVRLTTEQVSEIITITERTGRTIADSLSRILGIA